MSFLTSSSFQKRALSSVVLGPLLLLVVWYGQWPFMLLLGGAFGWAFYEWCRLIFQLRFSIVHGLFGVAYIAVGFYSLFLLREMGWFAVVSFLILIWASDVGAYFFGKFIGGRKLVPMISPNKTWAGLAGSVLCPAFIWLLYLVFMGEFSLFVSFFYVPLIFGLAGQGGDLFISFVKRRVNVKDTGTLIPGHGGVLDRIDSWLLSAPVFYFFISISLYG